MTDAIFKEIMVTYGLPAAIALYLVYVKFTSKDGREGPADEILRNQQDHGKILTKIVTILEERKQ